MENNVFCKDCKYHVNLNDYGFPIIPHMYNNVCDHPQTETRVKDPIKGIRRQYGNCEKINKNCDCKYFEKKKKKMLGALFEALGF